MEDRSGLMNEKDFMLKSRLEVKLNDLEKKHLETKEREAQTVGFLERKLRQVELEHKTELKLRRQLRYEVNNLRKKLLETYQLYTDTLEQNEQMRSEIDRLKGGSLRSGGKETGLGVSRQVDIQIQEAFNESGRINNENGGPLQRGTLSLRGLGDLDPSEQKLSKSFDARGGRRSLNGGLGIYAGRSPPCRVNKTVERIRVPDGGRRALGKTVPGLETSRDLGLKSERAKDWLSQIEELYKPLEYPKTCSRMFRSEPDPLSGVGAESSLCLGTDSPSDEECFSGGYGTPENTEDVITNTGFIIDQISQQDKELSTLLKKTLLGSSHRSGGASSKGRQRGARNSRK